MLLSHYPLNFIVFLKGIVDSEDLPLIVSRDFTAEQTSSRSFVHGRDRGGQL
ncbi:hypothetical protein BT96DRAFT_923753 [Gymnopus androsaceus JB14]|uniref:Uncharacterized protein n=1 Tax=Gymnopus androsaceus JB14 TaxID=1447944 RepID=A0A6A4H743_9AGAR|nr:hypothetical protein BT96DRAFT_923753 [Gymnopus androsaceus JB14]